MGDNEASPASPLLRLPPAVLQAAQWTALVLLPAFTTLWLALGPIWGLPRVQEIGATLTAIDAFLGTILGVTSQALARAQATASLASSQMLTAELEAMRAEIAAYRGQAHEAEPAAAAKPAEGGEAA